MKKPHRFGTLIGKFEMFKMKDGESIRDLVEIFDS